MKQALYCVVFLLLSRPALGVTEIRAYVFGPGGGTSTGVDHEIRYTLGQNFVGTQDGTMHQIRTGLWASGPHATAVGPETPRTLSYSDHLYVNVPNPFNPSTVIQYDVGDQGGHVNLRIYDLSGRLVRTLIDRLENPGQHSTLWRGRDNRGSAVASGIYFSFLETPRNRFIRKMVLLR